MDNNFNEDLVRELEIGLATFILLEKRINLIKSGISLNEFRKIYKTDYSREVEQIISYLQKNKNVYLFRSTDKNYPQFYGIERNIPFFLMCRGNRISDNIKFGLVGTRRCDYKALHESFRLSLELTANGFSIVSGVAEGCDQSALYGAVKGIECGYKAPCYAVLGSGLDVPYPYGTERLKNQIIETGGCLISQFAPQMPPLKQNFPARNMVLSALSNICVVIQCPVKSGAMITADLIMQMGKDVYISRSGLEKNVKSSGTRKLFEDGCEIFNNTFDFKKKVICTDESFSGDSTAENCVRYGNKYYRIL